MISDREPGRALADLAKKARGLRGRRLARNYERRAWLLVTLQRLEEALELLRRQEAILIEIGDSENAAGARRDQAEILRGLGRHAEALTLLERYEAACIASGDTDGVAMARVAREVILGEQAEAVGADTAAHVRSEETIS